MAEKILKKIELIDQLTGIKWWGWTFPGFDTNEPTQKTSILGSSKYAARADHSHKTNQLIEVGDFLLMKNDERAKLATYPSDYSIVQQTISDAFLGGTYKGAVNTFSQLPTTNLKDGDIYGVLTDESGHPAGDYRYHNNDEHPTGYPTGWYMISSNRVPLATANYNGLLSSTDFSFIQTIKATNFAELIPINSNIVSNLNGSTGSSSYAARADHLHDGRYLNKSTTSAQTVAGPITFTKQIKLGVWGTSDIRTTGDESLLGYDTSNVYLSRQSGTTIIRSGATNLLHRKNGTDYVIWDKSLLTDTDYNFIGQLQIYDERETYAKYSTEIIKTAMVAPTTCKANTLAGVFSMTGMPSSKWYSGFVAKGWNATYAAWQLMGPADQTIDNNLYFRSGTSSWGTWRKVVFEDSLSTLMGKYLPLSGGTMTGQLNLNENNPLKFGTYGKNVSGDFTDTFRQTMFGTTSDGAYLTTFRGNVGIPGLYESYGSGLAWSTADTHAFINVGYHEQNKTIYVGAGAVGILRWKASLNHSANTFERNITLNGTSWAYYSPLSSSGMSFYAPTTVGTSGQFLKSNGSGAPTWTTITPALIGAAAASHTHNYLPLSGGTMNAGRRIAYKFIDANNAISLDWKAHDSDANIASVGYYNNAKRIYLIPNINGYLEPWDGTKGLSIEESIIKFNEQELALKKDLSSYLPLTGGTLTGKLIAGKGINLNNAGKVGISFYNTSYYNWYIYMTPAGAGDACTGGKASVYGDVTSLAIRQTIENVDGYGWIWDSCTNAANANPDPKMSLGAATGNLRVKGNVTAAGGFFDTSDKRLKSNIKNIELKSKINLYEFDKNGKHSCGVIAQEIEKDYPFAVTEDKEGYKFVNYNEVLVLKCKELEEENNSLRNRLDKLEKLLMDKGII